MAGKIHKYDIYDLRRHKIKDVSTFIDIGANKGTTSIMARILFPYARIIAIEPGRETFKQLKTYLKLAYPIEIYNIALGCGMMKHIKSKKFSGLDKCVLDKKGDIEGKTLSQIFDYYKIDVAKPYIIKIDCEGSERFLLSDKNAIDIIKNSLQLVMELHLDVSYDNNIDDWNLWLKNFKDTHDLLIGFMDKEIDNYYYILSDKITYERTVTIELRRKI